jgi:FtsZ-binding cell division protein ZapB
MGSSTVKLDQLRPVTFQYKSDPRGAKQYGLIAEEVARVYPELVVRDHQGRIISVRYDELAPMLLNEMKQQNQRLRNETQQQQELTEQNQQLAAQVRDLQAAVFALQASKRTN